MIAVLHQKGAGVRLKLRQQLNHLARAAVGPHKHLQEAVVDRVRVLGDAGVDKALQLALETEPVNVHLHVVRYLAARVARAQIPSGLRFLLLLFG